MANIPKTYVGRRRSSNATIVIEAALCLICPFSKKAWNTMKLVSSHYGDKVEFRKIDWVQVWHPQSYLLASSAAAVELLNGYDSWYKFTDELYGRFDEFVDEKVFDLTINQIMDKLATIANKTVGIDKSAVLQAMTDGSSQKIIKYHTKYGRQQGLHVSPTFLINGLIFSDASSSWTLEEWKQVLDPLVDK